MMAYLPVLIVFILYFAGIPIAFALFGAAASYFTFIDTTSPTHLLFQSIIRSCQSFPLLAIPFFIMAGSIMNFAGISEKLLKFTDATVRSVLFGDNFFYIFTFALMPRGHLLSFNPERK